METQIKYSIVYHKDMRACATGNYKNAKLHNIIRDVLISKCASLSVEVTLNNRAFPKEIGPSTDRTTLLSDIRQTAGY